MKKILLLSGILTASLFVGAKAHANTNVYRLYNANTGEHFYTASAGEKTADAKAGWTYEGTGWVAPSKGEPVYRLYNPNAKGGDHYYTKSKGEANHLVAVGWKWDNNAKAVFYSGGKTSVYVAYNANAQSGAHNYTTSSFEQKSLLNSGWKFGATAWNAVAAGQPAKSTMNLAQIKAGNFSSLNGGYHQSSGFGKSTFTISKGRLTSTFTTAANPSQDYAGSTTYFNLKLAYAGLFYGIPEIKLSGTCETDGGNSYPYTDRILLFPVGEQIPNIEHVYSGQVGPNMKDEGIQTHGTISSDSSIDRLVSGPYVIGIGGAFPGTYSLIMEHYNAI